MLCSWVMTWCWSTFRRSKAPRSSKTSTGHFSIEKDRSCDWMIASKVYTTEALSTKTASTLAWSRARQMKASKSDVSSSAKARRSKKRSRSPSGRNLAESKCLTLQRDSERSSKKSTSHCCISTVKQRRKVSTPSAQKCSRINSKQWSSKMQEPNCTRRRRLSPLWKASACPPRSKSTKTVKFSGWLAL